MDPGSVPASTTNRDQNLTKIILKFSLIRTFINMTAKLIQWKQAGFESAQFSDPNLVKIQIWVEIYQHFCVGHELSPDGVSYGWIDSPLPYSRIS